ncbi:RNA polymerase sigma factor [Chitinophaga eiseniae]|uniref:Sigma-70 family RNA polymerase sigma factor n=1 Tax=Chitinophaga eiseniae TaxID=634771 RepID=A0A847SP94_9BACT|nr:sigma-70 family RNA polymerase sigma factor [Chitinophaga eiseniae]NLR81185.1 sigma-70 family RNA polymerase sigma factor [Chitinophaga eiseniae]
MGNRLNNEDALLEQVAAGDHASFKVIFTHYWRDIYLFSLKLTKSPDQAKDLAQDIFARLWDMRQHLPEVRNFKAFLYTVSRNLILDHLRKKVFSVANEEYLVTYFDESNYSPHLMTAYKELENTVQEAVRQLPPQLYQVYYLSRVEGLTHEEIGQKMNITRMTSKNYMVRALQFIRKYMAEHGHDMGLYLISYIFLK